MIKPNIPTPKKRNLLVVVLFSLLSIACSEDLSVDDGTDLMTSPASRPNILLIIADDVGKDALNGYAEGTLKPSTPHLDSIKNSGLSFDNFWSYPTCSPTRASIITGKFGYRTNVKVVGDQLDLSETSLQEYINNQTNDSYATALVGKWHLSGNNNSFNPEVYGIDYYAGILGGGVGDYYQWPLSEAGATSTQSEYATKKLTDLAIDWIGEQSKPWFLWMAYNAPHTPFHVPPIEMHQQGNLPDYSANMDALPYYFAAIEAMDYQIGKLLDNIPQEELANTIVVFLGDNGTPGQVAQSPFRRGKAKGSLYQGGVNVPFFVSGKGVSRLGTDSNLITSSDLFATISELAGVPISEIHDSKSLVPVLSQSIAIRNFQYSEDDQQWAISNGNYKLIEDTNGLQEFYHLISDPYEENNLLSGTLSNTETTAKTELEAALSNIRQ